MYKLLLISLIVLTSNVVRGQGGPAAHIASGASLPAKCSPRTGDIFILVSGATGSIYYCDTANHWTVAGSGLGSTWGGITGTLSSQSDLQTALNAKAATSSLATVATSGSYTDLTSKPTIPAAVFPGSGVIGTIVMSGYANTAPTSGFTASGLFNAGTAASLVPVAGTFRNPAISLSGSIGNNVGVVVVISPDCSAGPTTVTELAVPPGSPVGGYVNIGVSNYGDFLHLPQYGRVCIAQKRIGGATAASVMTSNSAAFVSDDGNNTSILGGFAAQTLTASSTQYETFGYSAVISATEANTSIPMPVAGVIKNFSFLNSASPTNSYTATLMKNTVAQTLTATVGAGDAAGAVYIDTTHSFSVVAGDAIDIKLVTGASTQGQFAAPIVSFTPTDNTSAIFFWSPLGTVTTTATYDQPFGSTNISATETNAELTSPIACTARNLYVYQSVANAGGVNTTFTLYKNNSPTALTGTITSASVGTQGATGTGSMLLDNTHTVAIAIGDRISLQYVTNSGTSGTMGGASLQCN